MLSQLNLRVRDREVHPRRSKGHAEVWDNPSGLEWTVPSPAPHHTFKRAAGRSNDAARATLGRARGPRAAPAGETPQRDSRVGATVLLAGLALYI